MDRRLLRGSLAGALALAAGVLTPTLAANAASAHRGDAFNPDSKILVTYSGRLVRSTWAAAGLPAGGNLVEWGTIKVTLTWTAVAFFADSTKGQTPVKLDFKSLKGTVDVTDEGDPHFDGEPPNVVTPCHGDLSERPVAQQINAPTATTLFDLPSSRYVMSAFEPPLTAYMLVSSDTSAFGYDNCSSHPEVSSGIGLESWPEPSSGDANRAEYVRAWKAYDTFPGGNGPFTTRFDSSWSHPAPDGGGGVSTAVITSSISGGGVPNGLFGPFLTPEQKKALKKFYANDIKLGLRDGGPYCLNYLSGLGQFGSGVLLTGSGTVGPILVMAGATTALVNEPFCSAVLKRVLNDYVIAKDPPDPDTSALATPAKPKPVSLPACTKFKPSTRTTCAKLEAAQRTLVLAVERLANVAAAESTTMNRYSAANAAYDWQRSKLQGQHLEDLLATSRSDLASLTKAGKEVASILLGAHLNWKFSKSAAGRAIAAELSLLGKKGLTKSELKPYAGTSLTAAAFDELRDRNAL